MLEYDNLCSEFICNGGWCFCGSTDIATADIAFSDPTDVETDIVARHCLRDLFVMHFDGFDFSILIGGHKGHLHSLLHNTCLNTADGNCANTADAVHILNWKAERFIGRFIG